MRLLLITLPLLLVAFSVRAVPTASSVEENWPTTVEIFTENVTRTIVYEVTEPTLTGTDALETTEADVEYESDEDRLAEAKQVVVELEKRLDDARLEVVELEEQVAAKDAPVTETTTTEETIETKPMCTCAKMADCRRESMNQIDTCMDTCKEHIESYTTYMPTHCFSKYTATITEAEDCLFKDFYDYCDLYKDGGNIEEANWDELTSITYESTADSSIRAIWSNKHEANYNKIQQFFHCTKHCIHNHLRECTYNKGCALKMPRRDVFADKMKQCLKKNYKITNAMFSTCQCLAWQRGVKQLQGSCVFIGNQYYIDRA